VTVTRITWGLALSVKVRRAGILIPSLSPIECGPLASGEQNLASITIRNLDDEVKTRLCLRAVRNHRSMEKETRKILRDAVNGRRFVRPR